MSVQINWDHVNLTLINEAICSGFWYFDCDENSEIVNANWSHEFRKMLGYHDTLDFPNKLESVDSYVVETDKKAVATFYDRGYIVEKLKGLETELSLECRITLNGEERWVRNVIIRGEIEDSEYAMIFLRDTTEAKVESARHLQMPGAFRVNRENCRLLP